MEVDDEDDGAAVFQAWELSPEIPTPGELEAESDGAAETEWAEGSDQVLEPPESEEESSAAEFADDEREGQSDGEEEWGTMSGQLVPPPRRRERLEVVLPTVKQLKQGELCWTGIVSVGLLDAGLS